MIAQIDRAYIRMRPTRLWPRLLSYAVFEGRPLTTKGQWLNPLVSGLGRVFRNLPEVHKVKSPGFILGTGRSGTTILGLVLSMHRDVGFLNEPKAIWAGLREDEDLIGSYHRVPARYRLSSVDAPPVLIRQAHRIYGTYLALSRVRQVVDKYPELIFRVPFVRQIFPDAKFIFLSRAGWDTCSSIDKWSGRLGQQRNGETHDWWGVNRRKWHLLVNQLVPEHPDLAPYQEEMHAWRNHTDMAALEWIVSMREGMRLQQEYPNAVLRVNYEALCQEPCETLRKISDFLDLETDHVFFDYAKHVLKPAKGHNPFDLAPEIKGIFKKTMRDLGYE